MYARFFGGSHIYSSGRLLPPYFLFAHPCIGPYLPYPSSLSPIPPHARVVPGLSTLHPLFSSPIFKPMDWHVEIQIVDDRGSLQSEWRPPSFLIPMCPASRASGLPKTHMYNMRINSSEYGCLWHGNARREGFSLVGVVEQIAGISNYSSRHMEFVKDIQGHVMSIFERGFTCFKPLIASSQSYVAFNSSVSRSLV